MMTGLQLELKNGVERKMRKPKINWNTEPHSTTMKQAVCMALEGCSTTKVAARFAIPARTLRRYVAVAKRKVLGTSIDGNKSKVEDSKKQGVQQQCEQYSTSSSSLGVRKQQRSTIANAKPRNHYKTFVSKTKASSSLFSSTGADFFNKGMPLLSTSRLLRRHRTNIRDQNMLSRSSASYITSNQHSFLANMQDLERGSTHKSKNKLNPFARENLPERRVVTGNHNTVLSRHQTHSSEMDKINHDYGNNNIHLGNSPLLMNDFLLPTQINDDSGIAVTNRFLRSFSEMSMEGENIPGFSNSMTGQIPSAVNSFSFNDSFVPVVMANPDDKSTSNVNDARVKPKILDPSTQEESANIDKKRRRRYSSLGSTGTDVQQHQRMRLYSSTSMGAESSPLIPWTEGSNIMVRD